MPHAKRTLSVLMAAVVGFALAVVAGLAAAKSFTLKVSGSVHVTNTPTKAPRVKAVDTHETVAAGPSGFPVYTFQGETTHHLICKKTSRRSTNCWAFWPPVTVNSAKGLSAQKGIKGNLGTFRNHGLLQVTLKGQPLYYFTPDIMGKNKKRATGDELKTFGSIWHVVVVSGGGVTHGTTSTSSNNTSTSGTSTGTTTTSCLYPPCY
jgi:predicted lipoprotein with Yx(FWY)xxD motif